MKGGYILTPVPVRQLMKPEHIRNSAGETGSTSKEYSLNVWLLQKLDYIAEAFKHQVESRKLWLLCGFSLLYFVITCLLTSRKLMWNDELFTFYISRLPSASDIWSALLTGADQSPPVLYMITRLSFSLFGENHISIRLPEVLGFWVMSLCLFRFVSKRSSALYGFVAMLFPLVTTAYDYAYEARPYGLVLGFCGLSLLCWQSAAEGYYRKLSLIGLAVSIAGSISSHYYGVLLLFPLAIGEVMRSVSLRRLDLPVWGIFGTATTPLLLFLPLIEQGRTYSAHFWAPPHWRSVPEFYYYLLIPSLVPLVAMLVLAAVYSITYPSSPLRLPQISRPVPHMHEIAAAIGFIAIPMVAFILAIVTGAFTNRYGLPAVIGFSILLSFATYRLLEGRAILGAVLLLALCGGFIMLGIRSFKEKTWLSLVEAKTHEFLQAESGSDLPIVVSDAHTFMMLAHYAPQDIALRLLYLADPDASLRHIGTTSVDRQMLDLKPWLPFKIEKYGPYVTSRQRFLVYGSVEYFDWMLYEFQNTSHLRVELKGRNNKHLLFLVSPKQ